MRINIIIEELKEYFNKLSNKELKNIANSKDLKYDDFTKLIHSFILKDRVDKGIKFEKLYYTSGKLWYEEWWLNDQVHRPTSEGPATIHYYENGHRHFEVWYLNGQKHRPTLEGPAHITYYENGHLSYESWYLNDETHRPTLEGPAWISYDKNGKIDNQKYFKNGEVISINE